MLRVKKGPIFETFYIQIANLAWPDPVRVRPVRWVNYFGISDYYRPVLEIDHWLRRRLRMCYWQRWRRARTKVRELLKLGTSLSASISVAMSRKGPWHLARTLATQTGMTTKWLKGFCL